MAHEDMLYEPLRQATVNAGFGETDDPNGAVQDGISRMEATIGAGRRSSSSRAYLTDAAQRPNLTIRVKARTQRIPSASRCRRGPMPESIRTCAEL